MKRSGGANMRKIDPVRIFEIFEQISEIPRCTGDEEAIGAFIVDFAKNLGLPQIRDNFGNVVVRKPATSGYESAATIILQGHMDMLCIKAVTSDHDFTKDPLQLSVSGDLLAAKNTALGSDNGIAIAFYMALLESKDIAHPPLEVVFTVQEQAGLVGARELDVSNLKGRYLINMDSESEGEFIVGCAGEERVAIELPIEHVNHEHDMEAVIRISGLKGGHSGLNIHLNRGNAGQLLAYVYRALNDVMPTSLISICAGEKHNVIPFYGELRIAFPHDATESLKNKMVEIHTYFEAYLDETSIDIEFDICQVPSDAKVMSEHSAERLIDLILMLPVGVNTLSGRTSELIDTSLNLGIVRVYDELVSLKISVRGITNERLTFITSKLEILTRMVGGSIEYENSYPAWNDEGDNHLRRMFKQAYKDQWGENPKLKSIHAGLECSILAQKLNKRPMQPPIEMISFGPDIFDAHTPEEAVSISSVRRTWALFQHILKQLIE